MPINLGSKIIEEKLFKVKPKIIFTHFAIKQFKQKKNLRVIKIKNYEFFKTKINNIKKIKIILKQQINMMLQCYIIHQELQENQK